MRVRCVISGSASLIVVVQSTHLRYRHVLPDFWPFDRARLGRVFAQRQVRSGSMIVIEIADKNSAQGALVKHDHMVETFPANGANDPFYISSLPGGVRCR